MLKCLSVTVGIIAILVMLGPVIYSQMDQREFNRRITAEEAAKGNQFAGKTAIVTGASSGIGISTAKVLYENGAVVIMACRNVTKAEKVRQEILAQVPNSNEKNLKVMEMDLGSLQSVQSFVDSFTSFNEPLNILINNAGIMALDDFTLTTDGIEAQFGVNHIGHFYLTQKLTAVLISSSSPAFPSRVINVASFAYAFAPMDLEKRLKSDAIINDPKEYSPTMRYGFTKACNIIYAKEYNKRYAAKGVHAVSLHPGTIRTGLQRYNFWFRLVGDYFGAIVNNACKSISQGAATTIRCAAMPNDEFIKNGGRYFEDCNVASLQRSDVEKDELGKMLWDLSEKMVESKGFPVVTRRK